MNQTLTASKTSKVKFLIGLFYLFYFALVGVYVIFLPKILSEIGFDGLKVGIIFSVAPMVRFILPFIFRKFGGLNSQTYKIALLLMGFSSIAFLLGLRSFYALLIINAIYGASMGVVLPFVETIALKLITKAKYGRVRLWGSIGFMAIALWLGRFLDSPVEAIYYLIFTAWATTFSGFFIIRFDTVQTPKENKKNQTLSLKKYWAWWIGTLIFQVSFGGFYNFFTIYETAHSISLEMTTLLWSFGVVCEILMLYFQGRLLERFSLINLIELSIITAVIRWGILWLFPDSLGMAFVSQAFHALNFALYYSASIAYVYQLYTQKRLAQQFFLGISFGLGGSLGAVVAGFIYQKSSDYLFFWQAVIAFLAWVFIYIHKQRRGFES